MKPADRLADVAERMLRRIGPNDGGPSWSDLRDALNDYRSTYDDVPPPSWNWAGRASDLAGRLEQVRAWAEKRVPVPYSREILNIIDGKVIGGDAPCVCGPGDCKKGCPVCSRGDCPKKSPADRLAETVEGWLVGGLYAGAAKSIQEAIGEYRSTRNGIGQTTAQAFGSPPDPILVARHLLDSLTGGAISSLIGAVRDEVYPFWKEHRFKPGASFSVVAENIEANLRALGEKIEE